MKKLILLSLIALNAMVTNAQTAYITSSCDNTVFVIDVAVDIVSDTIIGSSTSYGISVSPDGSKIYVANYTASGTLSVINTATNTVSATITVGSEPYGVSVSPDGSKVYVTNQFANSVSVINTATNIVTATIAVGSFPNGISVSPDGSKVYVGNCNNGHGNGTISVINSTTNTVTATIAVDSIPEGISVSPDGSKVYVANCGNNGSGNTVSVINTATNTVTATIPVGAGPHGISLSPDGSKVYVANNWDGTVSVINTAANTVSATIAVGSNCPIAFGNFISTYIQHLSIYTRSNAVICKGSDTTICGYATGGAPPYQYLWSNSSTSSCQTVSPVNTTNYSVTVTDANSGTATSSLTITVDSVAKPVITPSGSMLFSTAGISYQWNLNGNPISGATGQFYSPLTPGNYSVTVNYSNGCSATSDTYIVTGINELSNSLYISVYPNPANDNLTIESSQNALIDITNIQGQLIKSIATNSNKTNVDVSALPSGVYFVEVKTEKGVAVRKFVKE